MLFLLAQDLLKPLTAFSQIVGQSGDSCLLPHPDLLAIYSSLYGYRIQMLCHRRLGPVLPF